MRYGAKHLLTSNSLVALGNPLGLPQQCVNSTPNASSARIIIHSPGVTVYRYFVTGRFCRGDKINLVASDLISRDISSPQGYILAAYEVAIREVVWLYLIIKIIARQQIECPSNKKSST